MAQFAVLDSQGTLFAAGQIVLDSEGTEFFVPELVLDSDGNSISVLLIAPRNASTSRKGIISDTTRKGIFT